MEAFLLYSYHTEYIHGLSNGINEGCVSRVGLNWED